MNLGIWDKLRPLAALALALGVIGCSSSGDTRTITQNSSFSPGDPDGLVVASFSNDTTFGIRYLMIWWPLDPRTGEFVGTIDDALVIQGHYGSKLATPLDQGDDGKQSDDLVSRISVPPGTKEYMVIAAKPGTYGLYSTTHSHAASPNSPARGVIDRYAGNIPAFTLKAGEAGFLGDFTLRYGPQSRRRRMTIFPSGRDLDAARAALEAYEGIRVPLEPLDPRPFDGPGEMKANNPDNPEASPRGPTGSST